MTDWNPHTLRERLQKFFWNSPINKSKRVMEYITKHKVRKTIVFQIVKFWMLSSRISHGFEKYEHFLWASDPEPFFDYIFLIMMFPLSSKYSVTYIWIFLLMLYMGDSFLNRLWQQLLKLVPSSWTRHILPVQKAIFGQWMHQVPN